MPPSVWTRSRIAALIALLLLPLIVLYRPLLFGEAFVPADLLSYLSPWKAVHPPTDDAPTWNVLRFDGITQFYPWRIEAARQMRSGHIPLDNPHQFASEPTGTPLLANSQSAPLYPVNLLFYLSAPESLWRIFGLAAALHLLVAASGLYVFLRSFGLRRGACLLGAATWTLSGPVICWLSLPSFLAVSCWLPWLLLLLRNAHRYAGTPSGRFATLGAGGIAGLMLLAGHLQMALYGLLAALLYAVVLGVDFGKRGAVRIAPWLAGVVLVSALAVSLAAPQMFPAIELSRISHRAVTDRSPQLYAANNATAFPIRNLVTFLAPDFYGNPNRGVYWNDSDQRDASGKPGNNYGEWAAYVGVLPLLLAVFALGAVRWLDRRELLYFPLLIACALLIATGSPLNLLLFYTVPGYASMANPARVLTVAAFALAALAAFGADVLLDPAIPAASKKRAAQIAVLVPVLLAALGASGAARWAREAAPQTAFGDLLRQADPGLIVAGVLLALSAGMLFGVPLLVAKAGSKESISRGSVCIVIAIVLTVADLAFWGAGYNPSAKPEAVYPVTPGIQFLQTNGPQAKIAVLNDDWTLGQTPPHGAALPPNALTVYGLHDVGGYDSLFRKVAKDHVAAADGGRDASPPANGNMVFVKSVDAAVNLGARYIVAAPDAPAGLLSQTDRFPNLRQAYSGADLLIYENPNGEDVAPVATPAPASFSVGLFLALCGVGALAAATASRLTRRGS